MAYVVRAVGSQLTEDQVMQFVTSKVDLLHTHTHTHIALLLFNLLTACSQSVNFTWKFQVAPYKKVRRVAFISAIPKSAAGKILRKELVSQSQHRVISKL